MSNPHIAVKLNGKKVDVEKACSWVCTGENPAVITVNFGKDNVVDLNLKSVIYALEYNGYKITKVKK